MPPVFLVVARYTLLEAYRSRLLWLVILILLATLALTEFAGALAITEGVAVRSGLLGSLLRLAAVFLVSLFVIASMVRELNDKQLELVLALPIARASYFFGKFAGYSLVAFVTASLCALLLTIHVPPGQVLLWALSLSCELVVVIAFSLLCMFTFKQIVVALSAVTGFYLLARSIGALQLMGSTGPLTDSGSWSQRIVGEGIAAIAYALPEFDRFTRSDWLIYHTGTWSDLGAVVGQSLVYVLLLAAAALFDFYRKEL